MLKPLYSDKQQGVTLIELLVVITIMMTMMSLVAPLAINTVDRAEAQSEFLSFASTLRRASVKAFANGSGINVELKGNRITATMVTPSLVPVTDEQQTEDKILYDHSYQFLNFPESSLTMNRNGIPNMTKITVMQRGISKKLDLIALLER